MAAPGTGTELRRLPDATRPYWLVTDLLGLVIVCVGGVVVVEWANWSRWWLLLPGAVAAHFLVDLVLIPFRHAHYRYRVTPREVFISRGRIIRRGLTVATPKILNAEVSQGPIQRWFKLATVTVHQVVGEHDLGPVRPEEAERLRLEILAAAEREVR